MNYKGWIKGRTIEVAEPLPFAEGQLVKVSLEAMASSARSGSPQAILEATRQSPHLLQADVAALETAIQDAKLPAVEGFVLNDKP
jgi:hypothetical protein